MLRLRNVAALQRSLNTKAFIPGTDKKDEVSALKPRIGLNPNKEFTNLLSEFKSLPNQRTIKGCNKLEDVTSMMDIYRKARDHPDRTNSLAASDIVNAILETTRQRDHVFRKMFFNDRNTIIRSQNEVLLGFLDEILEDLRAGRSYLSAYAIAYMLTALSGMGRATEIVSVWKQLMQISESSPHLATHLKCPTVVSAALNQADPSTMSLEFVQSTYESAVEQAGKSILLDEALIKAYLRFSTAEKVAEKYLAILEEYPLRANDRIFDRIHNRILTELKDLNVATAFFEMGIKRQSHVKRLHPAAVANYLKLDYSVNHDWNSTADIFLRTAAYYAAKHPKMQVEDFGILVNAVWEIFLVNYPLDSQQAREDCILLINKFNEFPAYANNAIFENTALSCLSKHWLSSEFISELVERRLNNLDKLGADSCRVILNTRPPIDTVKKVWAHRESIEPPVFKFDYCALIKSANTQDKAQFALGPLINAVLAGSNNLNTVRETCLANPIMLETIRESENDVLIQFLQ